MWGNVFGVVEGEQMMWGARAIFVEGRIVGHGKKQKWLPPSLDLVPDRQGFVGQDNPGKADFITWVNKQALPAVSEWVKRQRSSSTEVFEFKSNGYIIKATPNASYGYVYMLAWVEK